MTAFDSAPQKNYENSGKFIDGVGGCLSSTPGQGYNFIDIRNVGELESQNLLCITKKYLPKPGGNILGQQQKKHQIRIPFNLSSDVDYQDKNTVQTFDDDSRFLDSKNPSPKSSVPTVKFENGANQSIDSSHKNYSGSQYSRTRITKIQRIEGNRSKKSTTSKKDGETRTRKGSGVGGPMNDPSISSSKNFKNPLSSKLSSLAYNLNNN
jgi:hypothetical protein